MKPVVDLNSTPAPVRTAAAPASHQNNTLPIMAGGALVLLAAGGAAYALSRRRRHEDEEWIVDESMHREPEIDEREPAPIMDERTSEPMAREEHPTIVAPPASAFAWGNQDQAQQRDRSAEPMVEEERNDGESWIERAYRGPSPSNPSVSLKARLKRAAFFDKRERDAAAGRAAPLDTTAGLPDALVDEQEGELA